VVTGYGDDPRRTLTEGDKLFRWALHAWRYQDDWPYEIWVDFWEVLLPQWSPPEGVPSGPRERLERVTGKLHAHGLGFAAIGEAIDGYQPDTLRRAGVNGGAHDFIAGTGRHRLIAPPAPGAERFTQHLRGDDGSIRDRPLAALAVLPRVYDPERDEEPPVTGFNMLRIGRGHAGARPRTPVHTCIERVMNLEADASPCERRTVHE